MDLFRITKRLPNLVLLSGILITQTPVNNSQNDHELLISSHVEEYISLVAVLCKELAARIDCEKDQTVNNRPGIIIRSK